MSKGKFLRITRRSALTLGGSFVAGLAMPAIGRAQSGDVIRFGLMSSFSGPAASFGEVEGVSVDIAIEDINAAGGVKVGDKAMRMELIKYDHVYNPSQATTLARQAILQDGVKFLEVLGGGVIPAVQSVSEPAKVLMFGQGGGTHWLGDTKPYSFQPFYNIGANAVACLEYIKQSTPEANRLLMVYPDDDMGESIRQTVSEGAKRLGFEYDLQFVSRSVTDYYPLISSFMRNPPHYIDIDGMPGPQYASLAQQSRENGYEGHFIFSTSLDSNAFKQLGATDTIVGSLNAPAWSTFPTEIGQRWMAEVERRLPGNMQMWTGRSYDNLMVLKAAIEAAGSLDTDAIREQLTKVVAQGLAGEVRYQGQSLYAPIPVGKVSFSADGELELEQVYEAKG